MLQGLRSYWLPMAIRQWAGIVTLVKMGRRAEKRLFFLSFLIPINRDFKSFFRHLPSNVFISMHCCLNVCSHIVHMYRKLAWKDIQGEVAGSIGGQAAESGVLRDRAWDKGSKCVSSLSGWWGDPGRVGKWGKGRSCRCWSGFSGVTRPLGNTSTHDVVLCIYKYILYVCVHTYVIVYVHIYLFIRRSFLAWFWRLSIVFNCL